MLTRKQSLRGDIPLADYGPDENYNDNTDIQWVNKQLVSSFAFFKIFIHLSVVSCTSVKEHIY